ncbi:hypothetical protein [Caenimonas soli]|jgi:hypothetical protein|uniref:hypothetical protein n=1 Tax=Caenimonas soli TaxID=2735555 RepID=UPI0015566941|nr:hypothetical protein [Caenimonas soli]NPC58603.1 hypothetical protein [Caenimonas soli]
MQYTYFPNSNVRELLVAAALERYQASWDELLGSWFDRELYRAVNADFDNLRNLMAALPQFSEDLVQVVMRHAQLLLAIAKPTPPQPKAAGLAALRQKHSTAIQSARGKCLRPASP